MGSISDFKSTPSNEHGLIKWKQFRGTIVVDMDLRGTLGLVGNWSFAIEPWTRILVLRCKDPHQVFLRPLYVAAKKIALCFKVVL